MPTCFSCLPCRVFGLREDFQQLLIRQEEEAWEKETLLLQVVIKAFEDHLQELIGLFQPPRHLVDGYHLQHMLVLKPATREQFSLKQVSLG